jgi:rhodanese-related sulfurtransferase
VLEGSGKYLILDVRSAEEYEASHLPNALHVPLPEITQKAASFDPSIPLITVCGSGGGRSAQAARQLKAMGFYVRWLCGGTVKGLAYS